MKKLNQLIECNYETPITGISVNTKDLKQGNLFICIKGDTIDRHDYIDEAIKKGAAALITNKDVATSIPYVKVDNPNKEVIPISSEIIDVKYNLLENNGNAGVTLYIKNGKEIKGYQLDKLLEVYKGDLRKAIQEYK